MEFTVRENISCERNFLDFPEIPDFFTSNQGEQRT